jgi:hypothetical protein
MVNGTLTMSVLLFACRLIHTSKQQRLASVRTQRRHALPAGLGDVGCKLIGQRKIIGPSHAWQGVAHVGKVWTN